MRAIPDSLDPTVVAEIDKRIESLGVAVPWAIESGSRAWGFPSPDSDYDCRFIYVRPTDSYLSLWPQRDVIETPLDKIFDVNGWDISKAVGLMVRGNAVVSEWLRSPIIYSGDPAFREAFLELAERVADRGLLGRHYLHVGRRQLNDDPTNVVLKRVFYALRPAATLRWLRVNPAGVVPPMTLAELMEQADPPAPLARDVADLVAIKAATREVGRGAVPTSITDFLQHEFDLAEQLYDNVEPADRAGARSAGDEFFRFAIARWGDGRGA